MTDAENEYQRALNEIRTVQSVIDNNVQALEGLRTQCATTEEVTQKAIRDTESKLIKLFSRVILMRDKLKSDDYPKTNQWLAVVGVSDEAIKGIMQRNITIYNLMDMSEDGIMNLLQRYDCPDEESKRLNLALRNLKIWTERQKSGGNNTTNDSDIELHWSSYKSAASSPYSDHSPKYGSRPSTSSLPSEAHTLPPQQMPVSPQSTPSSPVPRSHYQQDRFRFTPPPTPPIIRQKPGNKCPNTPPPQKTSRMQLFIENQPLTRSKSQESNLANRIIDPMVRPNKNKPEMLNLSGSHEILYARRLSAESEAGGSSRGHSGHSSPMITSPVHSPPYQGHGGDNTLTVPGIKGHGQMMHKINHRFSSKIIIGSNCDICHKYVVFGKVCKYCRFKCHKDCASRAAPACCLPSEYVDTFLAVMEGSPNTARRTTTPNQSLQNSQSELMRPVMSVPMMHRPDSSSASSCNSSTPSSPALMMSSTSVASPSPGPSPKMQNSHLFQFPDIHVAECSTDTTQTDQVLSNDVDHESHSDVVSTITSNGSDKTLVGSNNSEQTLLGRVDSVDSQDDPLGHSFKRVNSLSVALKEWDIPYEQLQIGDPIGTGRFGAVYKGQWHGDVAIKMLHMDPDTDNQAQLAAFKLEVAMLRKTRHENLVLFMGACMKPPHLAIVTSLCKGHSLYTYIHVRKEKFLMNKIIIIAQQVAQGMGYLHAKGIVHKDLKTKNIFIDKDKVVISDFGLFNVTKLCHFNRRTDELQIPPGWLCYLSPEIIRSLQAGSTYGKSDLPFTEKSDVYAFGTVWYELLTGEWPFKNFPPECIIWKVGRGVKQSLGNIVGSRDVKDVLIMCWSFHTEDRPKFSQILKAIYRLPKKPFQRSPSHPISLSRSADPLYTA
ncbi:hypothetical protein CHS0354_030423 [Potamilus streckersoni]|uniref:Kinase suppressor of Ras 2 n=1 Tax=Potamilus streckersoni TaxID=2493646 RepID=A0AAE0VRE4_9BIVA|nr:hypothetical protein CHS0354_030423 [Potamilus streckersoni]